MTVATTATTPTRMRAYSTVVTPSSRAASNALNLQYRLSMRDALPGQVPRTANNDSTAGWPVHRNSAEGAGRAESVEQPRFPYDVGSPRVAGCQSRTTRHRSIGLLHDAPHEDKSGKPLADLRVWLARDEEHR